MVRVVRSGVVALVALTAGGGCVMKPDRERGFDAGVKAVQNVRDMNGPMGEAVIRMAEFSPNPPDPKKSPEWNGGFRAGVRQELDNPSPRD